VSRRIKKAYSRQFREQAVDLVNSQGMSLSVVARELGMPISTLAHWLVKTDGVKPAPGAAGASAVEPAVLKVQVAELQKQVRRLEMEKEILKKATAYFASQGL
jgi:transposase